MPTLPSGAGWTLEVDPGCAGWRLDIFLSTRIERLSRTRAAQLIAIDLDDPDRQLKKSSMLRAGMRLFVRRPLPDADATPSEPAILFADDDLLVLDKPPDLAVHPTASRYVRTVTHWIEQTLPGPPRPEPIHRLDVETSGVLLCARHAMAVRSLKTAFAERRVSKRYHAVVEGQPPDAWTSDTPLGFATDSAVRIKIGLGDKAAETRFRVLQRGGRRALVEAIPISGRQHQIRVHLAMAGHPIVGDKLYGPDEQIFLRHIEDGITPDDLARLGHSRHALHAIEIKVDWRGTERCFTAPWPEDLDALIYQ
ncbi:MAG: 23S rRNA pseudouridine1911/1915/1917 synthase [Bradymonadia bacterium]|jgi:23S rRNA pseudouridine1911/1915/1917 synthase